MLNKKINNILKFIFKVIGLASLFSTLFFIIFFQSTNNPDWGSYLELFNKTEYYLPEIDKYSFKTNERLQIEPGTKGEFTLNEELKLELQLPVFYNTNIPIHRYKYKC